MPSDRIRNGSVNALFPYGQREDHTCTLVACNGSDHLKRVIAALPIPGAMYVTIGAQIAGRRFTKAIIFTHYDNLHNHAKVFEWVNGTVRTRMMPDTQHEVYEI